MTRTIKFRAWDKENKKWIENFVVTPNGRVIEYHNHTMMMDITERVCLVEDTGLTDKNGKEIYEGDIVKDWYQHPTAVIMWKDNGFYAQSDNVFGSSFAGYEVIGNIYENPELLTPIS